MDDTAKNPDTIEDDPGASGAASASVPCEICDQGLSHVGSSCPRAPSIVQLVPRPTFDEQLKTQAVEVLEELLQQARAGEIAALVVCFESTDSGYGHRWTGTTDIAKRLGMLRLIEHRIMLHIHEGR